jgi:SAM-dependent methyltransferase
LKGWVTILLPRSKQDNPLGRLYAFHHSRRFLWLRNKLGKLPLKTISILELGCGDARSVDYIPLPIVKYIGLDAGMKSGVTNGKAQGLEAARERYGDRQGFYFLLSARPDDLAGIEGKFDVAIVLETFEYLGTANLEAYISSLAEKLQPHGVLLATMPNEKGVPLLAKALGARISGIPRSRYTALEFVNAVLGRMNHVPRNERGRKGFDYAAVVEIIRRHFQWVRLESIFASHLPLAFSPTIGLIATHAQLAPPAAGGKSCGGLILNH